jgi:glycosyltransferase involved in cell wall biosynthesis
LVTTLHGWGEAAQFYGWAAGSPKAKFYNFVDQTLIRGFDKVIATSHAVRGLAAAAGLDAAKLAIIPNGIDLDTRRDRADAGAIRGRFGILEEDRLIVAVGRVSPEKGHRYLLEAAALVVPRYPQVRFLIAGDGPLKESLAELTSHTGLHERFILAGFQSPIGALLSAADLFVLPSLTESFPLALLEAMAYGKAVVATDVGGVREAVVDGVTGLLVPARDSRRLAEAILELLADEARMMAMGEAGRAIAQAQFSDAGMVQRTQQLYQDLLGGGSHA